jgi:hypothetical protein
VVYRFLRESFNAKLEEYCLLHFYELPLSVSVADFIHRVVEDMERCPLHYQFTTPSARGAVAFSPQEVLPLQLLEIVNRGVPRPSDGQIRLHRTAHTNLTIGDLTANRVHFAVPTVAIEANYFIIHFGEIYHTFTITCSSCSQNN